MYLAFNLALVQVDRLPHSWVTSMLYSLPASIRVCWARRCPHLGGLLSCGNVFASTKGCIRGSSIWGSFSGKALRSLPLRQAGPLWDSVPSAHEFITTRALGHLYLGFHLVGDLSSWRFYEIQTQNTAFNSEGSSGGLSLVHWFPLPGPAPYIHSLLGDLVILRDAESVFTSR